MDKKIAAPGIEATLIINTHANNTTIHIICPYEHRLLLRLLTGKTSRKIKWGAYYLPPTEIDRVCSSLGVA